ncbi:DUF6609 family protein [Clostridium pasteurianum]|uniref:Uncharacterized protein n=1 Tax=Clostridium pasteurianum BC1 TaxID=86416 RepID=R4K460_CLOPA|nr:DUF6609 family protein [Clostridium pasteurianum]AGK96486.1 hypothetical protein Clopa_1548 [Clostridium pasteurianum BC1]
MELLLSKMGYEKGEKSRFLNKRLCGIWLIGIGFIIVLSVIVGGKYLINPIVFVIGYFTGMIIIFRSKTLKKKFSYGPRSKFQLNMSKISIILMVLLASIFSGKYFGTTNYRMIWLGALLATAIHFIPFSTVHGKLLLYISFPLAINTLVGILDVNLSFYYLAIIDGVIKIIFGVILLMTKKPQKIID